MATQTQPYPARLDVDYPESLDRVSTAFRIIWIIPIAIVLSALSATSTSTVTVITEAGQVVSKISHSGGGIVAGLFAATLLMVVFRQRYPQWWFDFALQFNRFAARISAYGALLTDTYPSTVDEQSVHLDIDYPDVPRDLNRWMPLVKWLLVIPHLVVLTLLMIGALFAVIIAWFAILFTGHLPPRSVRLRRRRRTLGSPRHRLRHPAGHRPLPTLSPQLNAAQPPRLHLATSA